MSIEKQKTNGTINGEIKNEKEVKKNLELFFGIFDTTFNYKPGDMRLLLRQRKHNTNNNWNDKFTLAFINNRSEYGARK